MKFFEVRVPVFVKETDPLSGREFELQAHALTVTVHMGDGATPGDAVKELARKLEELCNDAAPYSGG